MRGVYLSGLIVVVVGLFSLGCSSNVYFKQTDSSYEPKEKPADAEIILTEGTIKRPHKVIGVIEAQLDKHSRRPELNALLIKKAREVGADAVMLVEYDVDRDVYIERHGVVVGRGPWRHRVVRRTTHTSVKKTATGIAVIFL